MMSRKSTITIVIEKEPTTMADKITIMKLINDALTEQGVVVEDIEFSHSGDTLRNSVIESIYFK